MPGAHELEHGERPRVPARRESDEPRHVPARRHRGDGELERIASRREARREGDESTGALLANAVSDAGEIMRAEMKLAVHEWKQDARELGRVVPLGAAGGFVAAVGTVFLLISIVLALAIVLPAWAAYLIGGGITLVLAAGLALFARSRMKKHWHGFVPERTLDTLSENKRWIQQQLS